MSCFEVDLHPPVRRQRYRVGASLPDPEAVAVQAVGAACPWADVPVLAVRLAR